MVVALFDLQGLAALEEPYPAAPPATLGLPTSLRGCHNDFLPRGILSAGGGSIFPPLSSTHTAAVDLQPSRSTPFPLAEASQGGQDVVTAVDSSRKERMMGAVALVTGAASGIGRATAQRLASEGARVALGDINEAENARVADGIRAAGGQAVALRLDVTQEADWRTVMDSLVARWSRLQISVNCAGLAYAKPITELDLQAWRRIVTTNLDGVFLGTRYAMEVMKAGRGGCIINIASAAGIKPLAGNAAYGTSKAAIRFLTQVAALEGASHGIRVNSISPGAVATPMWQSTDFWPENVAERDGQDAALEALVRQQGFAQPDQIAAAIAFLASDEARHVNGADLAVDDTFSIS